MRPVAVVSGVGGEDGLTDEQLVKMVRQASWITPAFGADPFPWVEVATVWAI